MEQRNLRFAETIHVQYPHLFDDGTLPRLSRSEQKKSVSSSVKLLILLQLPGNGIRAPLLVLAVILAGLTALAAETPHDTPRERHARLTLFALPFHFCCSLLFQFGER